MMRRRIARWRTALWTIAALSFLMGPWVVPMRISRAGAPLALPRVVGLARSTASAQFFGWRGEWEIASAAQALKGMGLSVRVLEDEDVEAGRFDGLALVVLPNARCLSTAAADQLRGFVQRGGSMLAMYQTAYRDERNQVVGSGNNFHLSDLYGADFRRWISMPPVCGALAVDGSLLKSPSRKIVQLGRNTSMLIVPRAGTQVLATWVEGTEHKPSGAGFSAAIVENPAARTIYCGENLLAPENNASPEVRRLLAALMNRLVPGLADSAAASAAAPADYIPPYVPANPPPPLGRPIRVWIGDTNQEVVLVVRGRLRAAGRVRPMGPGKRSGALVNPSPAPRGQRTIPGLRSAAGGVSGQQMVSMRADRAGSGGIAAWGPASSAGKVYEGSASFKAADGTPVTVLWLNANGTYRVEEYRGAVEVRRVGEKLRIINRLPLEQYVAGVVSREIAIWYPEEALKAMADIARTFSLSRLGRRNSQGYDICSTVECQVYGGLLGESPATNHAVRGTVGEVVLDNGRYSDTTFHSTCGGVGENVELVWNLPPESILSAYSDVAGKGFHDLPNLSREENLRDFIDHPPDCFCKISSRFRWVETYTLADMERAFKESLPVTLHNPSVNLGTLQSVAVKSRTPSGRVDEFVITGSGGAFVVRRDAVRWLWSGGGHSTGGLQSSLFYLEKGEKDGLPAYTFHGGGWGHGVGMCQEGAAGMAQRGATHLEIIQHYYPGVTIVRERSR